MTVAVADWPALVYSIGTLSPGFWSPSGSPVCSAAAGGTGTVCSPKNGWVTPAGGDDLVRDVLGQIDRYGKPSPM